MPIAVSLETADVDVARSEVAGLFCPHRLDPVDRAVRVRLRARRFAGVGLVDLDYGAPVRIDPGCLESFYLVQMPQRGRAEVRLGTDLIVSDAGCASVLSPDEPVVMEWGADNPQSLVYFDRTVVERTLSTLVDRPLRDPLRFDLGMHMFDEGVARWLRAVAYAREESATDVGLLDQDRFAVQIQDLLITRLLLGQPHNYSELLAAGPMVSSRSIRRAQDLIISHHDEPLTVGDVAEAVGVSVRALQEGFRRDLGMTPTAFLRKTRLVAAQRHLLRADAAHALVTSIAIAHGFSHLGRFSVAYRHEFGEGPSATLAR